MKDPDELSNTQLQAKISDILREKVYHITKETNSINIKSNTVKIEKAFRQALNTLGNDRRSLLQVFEKLTEDVDND